MTEHDIEVEHSGYSEARGMFCDLYYINPNKTDYEILFPDGDTYRQSSEFHIRTEDWNHDGDIYEQFGAFFEIESLRRGEFLTPEMMIRLITDHHCRIPNIGMQTVMGKPPSLHQKLAEANTKQPVKNTLTDRAEIDFER